MAIIRIIDYVFIVHKHRDFDAVLSITNRVIETTTETKPVTT